MAESCWLTEPPASDPKRKVGPIVRAPQKPSYASAFNMTGSDSGLSDYIAP